MIGKPGGSVAVAWAICIVVVVSTASSEARAQKDQPSPGRQVDTDWRPLALRQDVAMDIHRWAAEGLGEVWVVVPSTRFLVHGDTYGNLEVPFASWSAAPTAAVGHPSAAVGYARHTGITTIGVEGRGWLGIVGNREQTSAVAAPYATVFRRQYAWLPPVVAKMTTGLNSTLEVRPHPDLALRAGLDAIVLPIVAVPYGATVSTEVEWRTPLRLSVGSNLHGVVTLEETPVASAEWFLGFDSRYVHARLALLMALTEPYGPGFGREDLHAAHFTVGFHLDGIGGRGRYAPPRALVSR